MKEHDSLHRPHHEHTLHDEMKANVVDIQKQVLLDQTKRKSIDVNKLKLKSTRNVLTEAGDVELNEDTMQQMVEDLKQSVEAGFDSKLLPTIQVMRSEYDEVKSAVHQSIQDMADKLGASQGDVSDTKQMLHEAIQSQMSVIQIRSRTKSAASSPRVCAK